MPNRDGTYKILVVGASNGGIEAFISILSGLTADFQLPIVFVLHQPRNAPSLLPKVLKGYTHLKVKEPQDKERILPGHIYVSPPDYHLLVEPDGTFAYSYSEPINYSRPSIDLLFQTAGESFGKFAVGLLLTGANQDGAMGLSCIRQNGGLDIVQSPETAKSRQMPEAAIKFGCGNVIDLIEIPSFLNELNDKYKNAAT